MVLSSACVAFGSATASSRVFGAVRGLKHTSSSLQSTTRASKGVSDATTPGPGEKPAKTARIQNQTNKVDLFGRVGRRADARLGWEAAVGLWLSLHQQVRYRVLYPLLLASTSAERRGGRNTVKCWRDEKGDEHEHDKAMVRRCKDAWRCQ